MNKEQDIIDKFGFPGDNQEFLNLPYKMQLSWNKKVWIDGFLCHKKVRLSLDKIFKSVVKEYSINQINNLGFNKWGGCLKVRCIAGSDSLSLHSWGLAVDIDPERNRLNWSDKDAFLASKDCLKWWEIWEDNGWFSLGKEENYDWMHIQALSFN